MNPQNILMLAVAFIVSSFADEASAQRNRFENSRSPESQHDRRGNDTERADGPRRPPFRRPSGNFNRPSQTNNGLQFNQRGPRSIDETDRSKKSRATNEAPKKRGRKKGRKKQAEAASKKRGNKKPSDKKPVTEVKPADRLPEIIPQQVRKPSYTDVYNSIRFSRTAHNADPSYRHNATMELLLGQLRPQTIYNAPSVTPQGGGYMRRPPMQSNGYPGVRAGFNYFVIPGAPFTPVGPTLRGRVGF
jgi:hypothetical protein